MLAVGCLMGVAVAVVVRSDEYASRQLLSLQTIQQAIVSGGYLACVLDLWRYLGEHAGLAAGPLSLVASCRQHGPGLLQPHEATAVHVALPRCAWPCGCRSLRAVLSQTLLQAAMHVEPSILDLGTCTPSLRPGGPKT